MIPQLLIAAVVQALPASIELDFSTAKTGTRYTIVLDVKDATGRTLVAQSIAVGPLADTEDIRDAIQSAVTETGLVVVAERKDRLRVTSKGPVTLGTITYTTCVNNQPVPVIAGPVVLVRTGTASLSVNGQRIRPVR
ncbi:MAG: hypothetical protein K2P78_04420 [Gemmataceae bacterium]|nr:hypothetical protein [Gemmataceae bacterium]